MADRRTDPDPLWLTCLREAVFASPAMPETDESFTWEGVTYLCHRRIEDDGTRLLFREEWLDPRTLRPQRAWNHEIDSRAFAGIIPETVFRQQVALLVEWLNAARPRAPKVERPPTFDPRRFARTKQPGRL